MRRTQAHLFPDRTEISRPIRKDVGKQTAGGGGGALPAPLRDPRHRPKQLAVQMPPDQAATRTGLIAKTCAPLTSR